MRVSGGTTDQLRAKVATGEIITKNLLELHDARVGANVVHGLGLRGLGILLLLKDIVVAQRLLR